MSARDQGDFNKCKSNCKHKNLSNGTAKKRTEQKQAHTVRIILPEGQSKNSKIVTRQHANSNINPSTKTKSSCDDKLKTELQSQNDLNGDTQQSGKNTSRENNTTRRPNEKYTLSPTKPDEGREATLSDEDKSSVCGAQKSQASGPRDDESLQMFLSTDNMDREDDYPGQTRRTRGKTTVFHRQYSDETKRKHEEIIRRILDEFDLEETKNKYRNSEAYDHRRNGKSLADFRFRSELIRMMGSEVIRLSDQTWSQRFQQKLREDYEAQLDEQAINLAEAERQRLHRLRVEGIITDSTGASSDDLMKRAFSRPGSITAIMKGRSQSHHSSSTQVKTGHQKQSSSTLIKTRSQSQNESVRGSFMDIKYGPGEQRPIFVNEESNRRERILSARRQLNTYRPPETVQSPRPEMPQPEVPETEAAEEMGEEKKEVEEDVKPAVNRVEEAHGDPELSAYSELSSEDPRVQALIERRKKRHRRLPPHIARLYQEETVEGLYSIAARLVSPRKEPTVEATTEE